MNPSDTLQRAMEMVGDRWTLLILAALLDRPRRFKHLMGCLPAIPSNILAARLKKLMVLDLIEKKPWIEGKARMGYHLTDKGKTIAPVIGVLETWVGRVEQPLPSRIQRRHQSAMVWQ